MYTKGPWGTTSDNRILTADGEHTICLVQSFTNGANARLIAAAPTMYELLEEVNHAMNEHFGIDDSEQGGNELQDRIRAIINKAKGE